MNQTGILFAVALGLLAHCLIGYAPFPFGDDFAYAPLAEFRANPALFPRDDQLMLFNNHALVYEWVYRLGKASFGVEPVFRLSLWLLAAGASVALYGILCALRAPLAALPLVLALGVMVRIDGLGRGDFGGLISPFFHHHYVALALVLGAVASGLFRRYWLAGVFLGLAAYAQPMTAFHGALATGLGALALHPAGSVKVAIAAAAVAMPTAIPILGAVFGAPETELAFDLIRDAYRFRSPTHYDPSWSTVGLTTLYLLSGWAGVALLSQTDSSVARLSAGMMAGFTVLHLVTVGVYKSGFAEWIGFFILDATRSSPVLFVLGPAVAIAGIWRAPRGPVTWAAGLLLLAILTLNTTMVGLAFVAFGALLLALREVPRTMPAFLIALATALVVLFPPASGPPSVPEPTREALERIRAETRLDALFVIPIGLLSFRHYAQRSAYVDFKLFSVAQPDQAALTRARIDEVTIPAPETTNARGWKAAYLWDKNQSLAASCEVMARTLATVGADYYLRLVAPEELPPECPSLPRTIQTSTLALYGPSG